MYVLTQTCFSNSARVVSYRVVSGPTEVVGAWKVQAAFTAIARLLGRSPIMEKYTAKADWERYQQIKGE